MKKVTCTILAMIIFCLSLTGCGSSSKSLDGYYSFTNHQYYSYYLKIDGSTAAYYSNSFGSVVENNGFHHQFVGNAEKSEDGMKLYFTGGMAKYSPLDVKLSEDGKTLYVSSDSDSEHWGGTLSFTKIDKKEWDETFENLKIKVD